ncbi:ferritin-like domain-containing protein [Hufsiella ginkgonis]|uniref:Iminophenyl-pyruvate dimer synthase domain-containing protein n=1 Tax=Hufsiella ginkgonis TaxID=2695274 RepID=A0A7K1XXD7_9SPHI|nr:ferritin-like protein [Hufsiella ginkgonis]MXV15660.1 hypothetical protein [Hufsiella ginkgonis]
MLKIEPKYIVEAVSASSLEELFPLVQNAIELEHSTIPPYLTAMFSFKPNTGNEIRAIIHSIVIEEMLHMSIAANILNALGGRPLINDKSFIPEYPTPLPMGIGSSEGLIVGLNPFSINIVQSIFMEIEEPENPIPPTLMLAAEASPEYATIGQFYMTLSDKIQHLAPDNLPGDPAKQVTSNFFSSSELFPILTKEDAVNAINIIVEQGEGTTHSPLDPEKELAHYYKFAEIVAGKKAVVRNDGSYSFSGDPIPFDPNDVYPVYSNTKAKMLIPGTEERRRVDEFNNAYSSLLNGLHRTFNGEPGYLDNTIGVMFDLKLLSEKLNATPFPGQQGYTIGAPYEWFPQP